MTKAEINEFRRRLLALKERLGGVLSELEEEVLRPVGGEAAGGLSDVPVPPAELGTENFEEELTRGLLENEEQIRAEAEPALDRIERGWSGGWDTYHQETPKERLKA